VISNLRQRYRQISDFYSKTPKILGLNVLLLQFSSPTELPERMDLFRQLATWLFGKGSSQVEARFRYFFKALESHPDWNQDLAKALAQTMTECSSFRLFTEVGTKVEHGLWGDIAGRILAKVLPAGNRHDTAQIFLDAFNDQDAQDALKSLSLPTLESSVQWFSSSVGPLILQLLIRERQEAILYLSSHAAHYGLSSAMQRRASGIYNISGSPFFKLTQNEPALHPPQALAIIKLCEDEVQSVYTDLENSGVSVDIVNRLETIDSLLKRIKTLFELQNPSPQIMHRFLIEVVEAQESGRSVFGYLGRHFYLLSRKVVERNGNSGEHYVAHTSAQLRSMFWSALGGGGIVVLMTIFKILYLHSHPAPLFLAVGIWIIYSAGFLAMQFSGSTLATKIPSFTASRLAEILKSSRQVDESEFTVEVRSTLKSQLVALFGNICGVIPVALLVDRLLRLTLGTGLMDVEYADKVLHNLHPMFSLAIPLGAFTGLQLWLSSLAGGWFENWVVYNRLPEIVRQNYRLRKMFGEASAARLANWILNHASGLATNIALGFLFGFSPLLGDLFGLNLNGNHVTISTASAMFAFSASDFGVAGTTVVTVVLGLLSIGVMNFVVSFAMALFIAARARKMLFWRMLYYLKRSF
jgi:site-specific recombinase